MLCTGETLPDVTNNLKRNKIGGLLGHLHRFAYTGLTGEQVDRLAQEHHIYMTRNGRISMAGASPVAPLAVQHRPHPNSVVD